MSQNQGITTTHTYINSVFLNIHTKKSKFNVSCYSIFDLEMTNEGYEEITERTYRKTM